MDETQDDLFWNEFIAEQERLINEEKIMQNLENQITNEEVKDEQSR